MTIAKGISPGVPLKLFPVSFICFALKFLRINMSPDAEEIQEVKEQVDLVCAAIAPHLITAIQTAIQTAMIEVHKNLAAGCEIGSSLDSLSMPSPEHFERSVWSNAYCAAANGLLQAHSFSSIAGTASNHADAAVEAYKKRFPNA
jgi:hypothetical protein